MAHTTVLLHSSIEGLKLKKGDVFLDGTINGGGHSALVAETFGNDVKIVGLDADEDALRRAEARLKPLSSNFSLKQTNFRNLDQALDELGIKHINAALFDIGLSSNQLEVDQVEKGKEGEENAGRGFSFQKDEPLLMTFKKYPGPEEFTAEKIVNSWDQENLEQIIRSYGEERYAGRIARGIVEAREIEPIKTTYQLVDAIRNVVPAAYQHGKIHFATRTFQALRITVNDELGSLKEGLRKAFERLAPGGRIAVIAFHSLEDRIVKQYFKSIAAEGQGTLITKKPIVPSIEEVTGNRRARSAKLRIIEKNSVNL